MSFPLESWRRMFLVLGLCLNHLTCAKKDSYKSEMQQLVYMPTAGFVACIQKTIDLMFSRCSLKLLMNSHIFTYIFFLFTVFIKWKMTTTTTIELLGEIRAKDIAWMKRDVGHEKGIHSLVLYTHTPKIREV